MMIPAISLWQPWATLIALGVKQFETRDYPPPAKLIGSRIAIHAAKTTRAIRDLGEGRYENGEEIIAALTGHGLTLADMPLGAVVCTAVIAAAHQMGFLRRDNPRRHVVVISRGAALDWLPVDPFGDYSPGRSAWLLTDVQVLSPPVPAAGRQGWWKWEAPDA